MNQRPRIVFFGSPEFAVPSLRAAYSIGDVVLVVTKPDEPVGRGQKRSATPVRHAAESLNVPIATPERTDQTFIKDIQQLNADVAVLVAYSKIIPPSLLAVPRHGFVNVHPSLLPRHRGASPIATSILAGDTTTGVTLMVLDEDVDHGPILSQRSLKIELHEHRPSLEQRLSVLGGSLLSEFLFHYLSGAITPKHQAHADATFTKRLVKESGAIHWEEDAKSIERAIRAFDPWPGTYTTWDGKRMKILDGRARPSSGKSLLPGTVYECDGSVAVACGDGSSLTLSAIQYENGKRTEARAFAHGHRSFIGSILRA